MNFFLSATSLPNPPTSLFQDGSIASHAQSSLLFTDLPGQCGATYAALPILSFLPWLALLSLLRMPLLLWQCNFYILSRQHTNVITSFPYFLRQKWPLPPTDTKEHSTSLIHQVSQQILTEDLLWPGTVLGADKVPGVVNVCSRQEEADGKQVNKILLGGDEECERVNSERIWIG